MTGFLCKGPHVVLGGLLRIIWTPGPKPRGNPELGGQEVGGEGSAYWPHPHLLHLTKATLIGCTCV